MRQNILRNILSELYVKIMLQRDSRSICFSLYMLASPKERWEKFGGKPNELIKPSAIYFRTAVTLLE